MALNENLIYLRKKHGMSQTELAEMLNVSRQAVSKWEVGSAVPTIENLIRLSSVYKVPVDTLVKGESKSDTEELSLTETEPEPAHKIHIPRETSIIFFAAALSIILLTALLFLPRHQSTPFIRTLAQNRFYLEGELVFWDRENLRGTTSVMEYRDGKNYGIEWADRSYFAVDGSYYIDGEYYRNREPGQPFPQRCPEDLSAEVEEMFAMQSVLSNYDFSRLEFSASYPMLLPNLSTQKMTACICEEYELPDAAPEEDSGTLYEEEQYEEFQKLPTDKTVRFYFLADGSLYAIQAKEDPNFIFYVSVFSKNLSDHAAEMLRTF